MTRRRPPLPRSLALAFPLVLLAVTVSAYAPSAHAAASDFPAGYQGYHTYAEVAADVAATAAAHPDIVQRFSIGASYQGRQMWAVKISDNVTVDENEPEVLFDGGTHSDEHMGVEMTLKIMHWLVDGYATDPRIKKIVDTREIWIIFIVNPDGVEYDIANRKFHFWRKNRQPTPGSRYIGTDLNRNFRYHWGGGGMTSSNPAAGTYRGPYAFSAPETQHMRDFLASRVVNGRQQIRVAMTFHESGRLVMWPYGYTLANVPYDMTLADHGALVTMGRAMAATNGYKPEQASDLYVSSGTTRDYEYGVYRIFAYTFELSIVAYPRDTLIASETGRNKAAVLYLLERAWCPLAVLGTAVRDARCGAFDDDLEVARGWAVNPGGTDTAPVNSRFVRSNPAPTYYLGVKQRGDTTSGSMAFVTGALAGSSANANDLDGVTTIRSVPITLPAKAGQRLTFRYVFAHDARSTSADSLKAIVETSGGTQTVVFTQLGSPTDVDGVWRSASIPMDAYAGQTVRLRFVATDGGVNNLVEAEIDDVRITYGQ